MATAVATPRPRGETSPRLDAFARYASVLAEQLEALVRPDLDRFQELAEERRALAREIDGAEKAEHDELEPLRRQVERCRHLDREVLARLRILRTETIDALRSLGDHEPALRRYVASAAPTQHRVDVRF